jgi:hypothetical protein
MKKVILLVLLALLASILVAAVPAPHQNSGLCFDPLTGKWVACNGMVKYKAKYPTQGEPRMEKVTSFRYVGRGRYGYGWSDSKCEEGLVISAAGSVYYYCIGTYQLPVGCNFRYQY